MLYTNFIKTNAINIKVLFISQNHLQKSVETLKKITIMNKSNVSNGLFAMNSAICKRNGQEKFKYRLEEFPCNMVIFFISLLSVGLIHYN